MRKATFLASVRADLLEILTYVANESGSVAVGENFARKLRTKCHQLAALQSKVSRDRAELRPGIRSFPYRGYVIFFRYVGGRFEVLNILEGHRDIDTHFGKLNEP